MPGPHIVRVVGAIGVAVFASTLACVTEVSAMSCAEIGSFARQIAAQRAEGVPLEHVVRRLRQSLGPEYSDAERELEKIIRAIYGMKVFATFSPEDVGAAYQIACEMG